LSSSEDKPPAPPSAAGAFVHKLGTTQFRPRFVTGDNDDLAADMLNLYGGRDRP
jgi:hypothetical protein